MEIEWNKDRENVWWREDNAVCMINVVLGHDAKGDIIKTKEYSMTLEFTDSDSVNIHLSRIFNTLDEAKSRAEELIKLAKALISVMERN